MKKIYGYARVSTREQNLDRQIKALLERGVDERDIVTDKASGKSLEREGYQMLFVQELTPLEISKRMHCSVKYVYDQKYLALQKLRRLLGGEPHGK